MKNAITILALLMVTLVYGQSKNESSLVEKGVEVKSIKIELDMDSIEDLKKLDLNDISSLFDEFETNTDLELIVSIKKDNGIENGLFTESKFTLKGNSGNTEFFMRNTQKIKNAVAKILKNQ